MSLIFILFYLVQTLHIGNHRTSLDRSDNIDFMLCKYQVKQNYNISILMISSSRLELFFPLLTQLLNRSVRANMDNCRREGKNLQHLS